MLFNTCSPVNLIHETKDRWVYAAAFGALTGQILNLIIGGSNLSLHISNEYVDSIFKGKKYILCIICMFINSFWNRDYSDDYYNDLSTTIFCSFCIHSWNSTDFVSLNWIHLCFIVVSIRNADIHRRQKWGVMAPLKF